MLVDKGASVGGRWPRPRGVVLVLRVSQNTRGRTPWEVSAHVTPPHSALLVLRRWLRS